MKPSGLLSLLRNLSYGCSFLVGAIAIIFLWHAWIGKPLAVHPPEIQHTGIGLWKFDFVIMPALDGAIYRGARSDSIFFSGGDASLMIGQEGTPAALIRLSNWKTAITSLLFLLGAAIFWLFGSLFDAVKKGESFSLQSVRRIRMMGWCFISYFVLSYLFTRMLFHLLVTDFPFQRLGSGYKSVLTGETMAFFVSPQNPSLDLSTAILGLFAFALAEVLRQGLLLKQENDLTV